MFDSSSKSSHHRQRNHRNDQRYPFQGIVDVPINLVDQLFDINDEVLKEADSSSTAFQRPASLRNKFTKVLSFRSKAPKLFPKEKHSSQPAHYFATNDKQEIKNRESDLSTTLSENRSSVLSFSGSQLSHSQALQNVLSNAELKEEFRFHCQHLQMIEILDCLDAIEQFRALSSRSERRLAFCHILTRYVLDSSECQVNLSFKTRNQLINTYEQCVVDNDESFVGNDDGVFLDMYAELFRDLKQSDALRTFTAASTTTNTY